MPTADPRYLARRLLATQVTWPAAGADFPTRPPSEAPLRLEELLKHRLADVVFESHDKAAGDRFQENPDRLRVEFEALGQALTRLRTTERVDRALLRRGEGLLDTLVAGVRRDEQAMRSELAPESLDGLRHADEMRLFPVELTPIAANSQYYLYLRLRGAGDALETLRDGLRAINRAFVAKDGPGRERP